MEKDNRTELTEKRVREIVQEELGKWTALVYLGDRFNFLDSPVREYLDEGIPFGQKKPSIDSKRGEDTAL